MGMRVTIDKFGRVLLPKAVRDLLGLRTGTSLEIETEEDRIYLHVLSSDPLVADRDGVLIFRGGGDGDALDNALREMRDERIHKQGGR